MVGCQLTAGSYSVNRLAGVSNHRAHRVEKTKNRTTEQSRNNNQPRYDSYDVSGRLELCMICIYRPTQCCRCAGGLASSGTTARTNPEGLNWENFTRYVYRTIVSSYCSLLRLLSRSRSLSPVLGRLGAACLSSVSFLYISSRYNIGFLCF